MQKILEQSRTFGIFQVGSEQFCSHPLYLSYWLYIIFFILVVLDID